MDIQKLIEHIAENSNGYDRFCFTVIDTNSPMYPTAVDYQGKEVAQRDYWGIFTKKKSIHNTDDAIAFLFDADIHLWQLVYCDIQQEGGLYGLMTTWNITLRR